MRSAHAAIRNDDRSGTTCMFGNPVSAFVYGTLMPGRLRWSSVAPHVVGHREAAVSGTLLDTGRGYPGLRLAGDGLVHGWLLELHPATEATVWEKANAPEGPRTSAGIATVKNSAAAAHAPSSFHSRRKRNGPSASAG